MTDILQMGQQSRWRLVEALRAELADTRAAHADALDRLERQADMHGQQIARLEQLLAQVLHGPAPDSPLPEGWRRVLHGGSGERLQAQAECYESGRD